MTLPLWYIVLCFVPLLTVEIILIIRCKKEFALLLQVAVLLGLVSLIPATLIQTLSSKLLLGKLLTKSALPELLVYSLLINGFVEEAAKAGCLFFLPFKKISFTQLLLLAAVAGLSFASFETVIYLIRGSKHFFVRFFTAEMLHVACTVCSAVTVWTLKAKAAKFSWFIRACLLHGLYNFFYTLGSGFMTVAIFCLITAIVCACKAFVESKKAGS